MGTRCACLGRLDRLARNLGWGYGHVFAFAHSIARAGYGTGHDHVEIHPRSPAAFPYLGRGIRLSYQ
jgi:hypothetical protein